MQVICSFTGESRKIELVPENKLEELVLNELAERTEKGEKVSLNKVTTHPLGIEITTR